jgi:hypothetical protein
VIRPPVPAGGSSGDSVARRIVAIRDGVARTRGDDEEVDDPWQLDVSSSTYPRVEFVVPWIGYPFTGKAGQGGWLLLVGMTAIALTLTVAAPWRRARQRRRPGHPARYAGVR